MDNKIIAKQMIDFYKSTFHNNLKSFDILQQQAEKMVQTFLQQATWLPAEGKSAIMEWVNIYNKGRISFKETADKNYKKVEAFFNASEVAAETKKSKRK